MIPFSNEKVNCFYGKNVINSKKKNPYYYTDIKRLRELRLPGFFSSGMLWLWPRNGTRRALELKRKAASTGL
jgi:hypothetical protein